MLLAAAVVAGVIALSERQGARSAATVADARRLGAQALSEERLDQALRLATAGVALDDSVATRSSLLSTLLRNPAAIRVLTPTGEELPALALSPDGETLAASDADGTVTLFDTDTYEVVGEHQAPATAYVIAFDPQGDSLAVAEDSLATGGTLEILDAATGRVRSSTSLAAGQGFAPLGIVIYAPDGRSLFVPYHPRWLLVPASVRRPPGHAARKARTRWGRRSAAGRDPGRAPPGRRRTGGQGARRGNASRHPPLPLPRRRWRRQPRRAHPRDRRPPTGALACSTSPPEGCGR